MKYILASASPRRSELLKQIGIDFEVKVSDCDESYKENTPPYEVVKMLALKKGNAVYESIKSEIKEKTAIIAADTVVAHNDSILGKPHNKETAVDMLTSLSGDAHKVYTGVCVIYCDENGINQTSNFYEQATVYFRNLDKTEIENYVNTGEPMDKAGAYGIQGKGAILVEKIDGDYFTIVGLPLTKLYTDLMKNK